MLLPRACVNEMYNRRMNVVCCCCLLFLAVLFRVKSTQIAMEKAGDEIKGAVLASDAFFPFSWGDSVEMACQVCYVTVLSCHYLCCLITLIHLV
jgi:hypothetical protein